MSFKDEVKAKKNESWKIIFKTLLNHKSLLISILICVIFVALLDLAFPLINSYAISYYLESSNPNRFDNIWVVIVIYAIFVVLYGVSIFLMIRTGGKIEATIAYEMRKKAYDKLQRLSFSYYDVTSQGWIMARMTSDVRTISELLSDGLIDFLWGIAQMIAILTILLVKNLFLGLIVLGICPIMLGICVYLRKHILKEYRIAKQINSEITASFNEALLGSITTKTLSIENDNKEELYAKTKRYRKSVLKAARISALFGPMVFILGYFGVGSILYTGGYIILNDIHLLGYTITVSSLYLFVSYTINFFEPVMNVSRIFGDFQQATASAERIVSLINEEVEIKDSEEVIKKYGTVLDPKVENYEKLNGKIEFKNVTFKYKTGEQVLKNFNLIVNKGESVAIVGHTGSGKSTIVNLISRFYEPTEGNILIDDIDYKNRSIGWLHSNLGYVLQTPALFSGSILENVKYGKLDATYDEVVNACKLVNVHEFIMSLPDKYDTLVGEGGSRLSLGERQLISFARAIVSNPSLIILDEATSSIDTKTEKLIQDALGNVLKNRTSIMIAHRLSTVVNADKIIVLDDGEILEMGTHTELLNKKGYYFELYSNQFKSEKEASLIE